MSDNLFCCYSLPLREHLTELGIRYEVCAVNPNNNRMMWIYMKNEKLNIVLKQWTSNRSD